MIELQSYDSGDYDPGPFLKRAVWLVTSRFFLETTFPWPSAFKSTLLRIFGAEIGESVVLKPAVKIKYPWFLKIGDHSWIGERVWIDNVAPITIEDQVVISQNAMLENGNHDFTKRSFDLKAEAITVSRGAWIAANATVGPGVTVGELAILSLGSVATNDLEPNGIYAGNPAEKIRDRPEIS